VHVNVWCDSCDGCIGGARLFCLDCVNNSEVLNALDLCSRPDCIAARVTDREDLKGAHEPNHKLVKARTVVLARQHGRAYTAATRAFTRVEEFCMQIAEASRDETASVTWKGSQSSYRTRSSELPICGNCQGPLSFPFWYCVFCQDNLFICDSCDNNGVPDLMRSSGKHTEEHHLIRCLAPEKAVSSTEQRLMSLERQFENLDTRFGNIEQLLYRLASKIESL